MLKAPLMPFLNWKCLIRFSFMTAFLTVIISALDFVEPLKGDLLPLNLYGPLEVLIHLVRPS